MRDRSHVDLVVVGAGAAGLAASRTARDLGLDVVTFEAMDRIGGRAWTDSTTFGFPWDAGCHWLHSASINPFTALADELGFPYRTTPTPWSSWIGGRLATAEEEKLIDDFIDSTFAAARRCGKEGIDVPIAELADLDSPWIDVLRHEINTESGVDMRAASTLDIARYRDTGENWPVIDGYGALVVVAAGDVPVELNAPVEMIDWSGPGVRIVSALGTLEADAVIVTASTAVLADELIAFEPPLPAWKVAALQAIPLGRANKVAVQIEETVIREIPEFSAAMPVGRGHMISLRVRSNGRNVIDGYVGGPISVELEAAGDEATIDAATSAIATLLGSDITRHITATAVTRWASEPYIRGAYSAAIPGQAERRQDLARPIGDRLFFAGEATSAEFFTTCHGAWETGIAAAHDAAAVIGRGATASK